MLVLSTALNIVIFQRALRSGVAQYRWLLLLPLGFGIGDFIYGLSNYIIALPFPNQLGSLLYVVPYKAAMLAASLVLIKLLAKAQRNSRPIGLLALSMVVLCFLLNTKLIVIPALFYKQPPLSPLLKALTVSYTVMESFIVGAAATLLIFCASRTLQAFLLGLLIMHVSDIAIRYQSVNLSLMGMSAFDYGWALGLTLIAYAFSAIQSKEELREESTKFLPVLSLRAITVGSLFFGTSVFWIAMSVYYRGIENAADVSTTLLMLTAIFCFAILLANLLNSRLDELIGDINSSKSGQNKQQTKFLPYEIQVIRSHFERLNFSLKKERDHALGLSSRLAHDIRSPIAAIKAALFSLDRRSDLSDERELLQQASKVINNLVCELLQERKRLMSDETILGSADTAVRLSKANHPDRQILFSRKVESDALRVKGLTNVLLNLINNAAEASEPGAPVYIAVDAKNRDYVIEIRDTGTGIPPEVLDKLINGESLTTKLNGNGIGFSSATSWAKENGVFLNVRSQTDGLSRGTTVTLTIPAGNAAL